MLSIVGQNPCTWGQRVPVFATGKTCPLPQPPAAFDISKKNIFESRYVQKPLQLESRPRFHCHQVTHVQEIPSPLLSRKSMPEQCRNSSSVQNHIVSVKHKTKSPTFPKLTRPVVIAPLSYNLQRRQPIRIIPWILPNIWTSLSWEIWKAANGTPNCFLSCKYLSIT